MSEVKSGTILVAHPAMMDPMFRRSVILILNHNDKGTLGLNIAGRQLRDRIFNGGPMPAAPMLLYPTSAPGTVDAPGSLVADSGYAVTAIGRDEAGLQPAELIARKTSLMLFGYAGWGEGQLAYEIEMGAWHPSTVSLADLLAAPSDQRYDLARAGSTIASLEPRA